MTLEMIALIILVVVAVALFATERLPVDLVSLLIMAALILSGIVTPEEGVAGFSHPATVTVTAMFVLSAGLYRSGAVNFVGTVLARIGRRNFWLGLLALMTTAGFISAFINDTAVVAIFMPIVIGLARDLKVSPSKLLIPLSFGALFGGTCTLIGTSTNILVSAIAVRYGEPAFGMFEFSRFGLVVLAAGVLYMLLVGVRLLPVREMTVRLAAARRPRRYLTEIVFQPESEFSGATLMQTPLKQDLDIESLEIFRDGQKLRLPSLDVVLRAGDVLRVRADVEQIHKLRQMKGIALRSDLRWQEDDQGSEADLEPLLVEAVIAPNSMLEGRTLRSTQFRTRFGAIVHGITHRGVMRLENLEDTVLRAGDVLLLEVSPEKAGLIEGYEAFVLISEVDVPTFRRKKIPVAVAIIAAVVGTAASGLAPIMVSAIAGGILMILTGCLTLDEAYKAVQWKVVFLLGGVLALGHALEKTGAALYLANLLVETVGTLGPTALVSAFYLMTSLMTEVMSNNATAALLAPIAIATAEWLGVDSRPFLMAVTYAASAAFMTPVGYQSNTLIYGPGNYRYVDFLKVGTPLNLMFWVLATFLIPWLWPFHPSG